MKQNGTVIYRGKSRINSMPIVAILTGLVQASLNRKTGDMLQLFLLPTTQAPSQAQHNGCDRAVCGNCPLRPKGFKNRPHESGILPCYVNTAKSVGSVYAAWLRGTYAKIVDFASSLLDRAPIRLGAFGNPSAMPLEIARNLVNGRKWTGYEHMWRTCNQGWRRLCMASVESLDGARAAWAKGWRTFRATGDVTSIQPNERICPATIPGSGVTCAKCLACNGNPKDKDPMGRKVNIVILSHK